MELQKLEKMINTYLNDIQAFGEDNEYDNAKEVLIDFLLYFQSIDDEDFIDSIDEYYEKIDTDLGYDFDDDDED
jgi:hypothetical protein